MILALNCQMKMMLKLVNSKYLFSIVNVKYVTTLANADLSTKEEEIVKPFESIPGPKRNTLLRQLRYFAPIIGKYHRRDVFSYNDEMYKTYGPLVKEAIKGNYYFLHVFDPKDIEKVFRNDSDTPHRPALGQLARYRKSRPDLFQSNGVFGLDGKEWYVVRKKMQAATLRPREAQHYLPAIDTIAEDFVNNIKHHRNDKKEIPNFNYELSKWALESIGFILYNTRLGCLNPNFNRKSEGHKFIRAVNETFNCLHDLEGRSTFSHVSKFWRRNIFKQLSRSQEFIGRTVSKYMAQTLKMIENDKGSESLTKVSTLLESLILHNNSTPEEVVGLVNDIMLAAVDTTSSSTGFLLFFLARYPDKQNRLFEELKSIYPKVGLPITTTTLNSSRYLKACIKESMRLRPIIESNMRQTLKPLTLSNYHVPAGTLVLMHHRNACTQDENFENAKEFSPERWLREGQEQNKNASFAFLPFGHGGRMCIGRRIAEFELYAVLTKIIERYKIDYHYEDIQILNAFVGRPTCPFPFTFTERNQ